MECVINFSRLLPCTTRGQYLFNIILALSTKNLNLWTYHIFGQKYYIQFWNILSYLTWKKKYFMSFSCTSRNICLVLNAPAVSPSIVRISWWQRSSCSSLKWPKFSGKRSKWLKRKCIFMLMLHPTVWKSNMSCSALNVVWRLFIS